VKYQLAQPNCTIGGCQRFAPASYAAIYAAVSLDQICGLADVCCFQCDAVLADHADSLPVIGVDQRLPLVEYDVLAARVRPLAAGAVGVPVESSVIPAQTA
jgi:hypothetical protein